MLSKYINFDIIKINKDIKIKLLLVNKKLVYLKLIFFYNYQKIVLILQKHK